MKLSLIAAAAAVLLAPAAASAADLSGSWKLELSIAGMMFETTCQMTQAGAAITGSCTGADPAAGGKPTVLTGTVDGSTAKFAYDITYQGNPMHVAYTGAMKSDTAMDGAVDVQIAQGTFTGAKQ